jgi:hypothetical protein
MKKNLTIVIDHSKETMQESVLVNGIQLVGLNTADKSDSTFDEASRFLNRAIDRPERINLISLGKEILKTDKDDIDLALFTHAVGYLVIKNSKKHRMDILQLLLQEKSSDATMILDEMKERSRKSILEDDPKEEDAELLSDLITLITYAGILYIMNHEKQTEAEMMMIALSEMFGHHKDEDKDE